MVRANSSGMPAASVYLDVFVVGEVPLAAQIEPAGADELGRG